MENFAHKRINGQISSYSNPTKASFNNSFQQVKSSLEARPKELRGPFTKSMEYKKA